MSSAAARIDDPISHTSAFEGLLLGLAVGAVAAVAVVGTGGLAAVAIVGAAASTGAGLGQVFGSMNTSEAGAITSGSPNVRINGRPAARAHVDHVACSKHSHKEVIAMGSAGVRINGQPAARVDDKTECGGVISSGSSNVRIGGGTKQTDEINPEVPVWLEWTVAGVGIASAVVLVGPIIAVAGTAGGMLGGTVGYEVGGELFGEGSNAQKLMMLGGGFLGGGLAGKGGMTLAKARYPNPTTTWQSWNRHGMVFTRTLDYRPTSGTPLKGAPGKTTTLLGNFNKDTGPILQEMGNIKNQNFGARPGDFQVLNVPDNLYKTPTQFWRDYNEPWLSSAVNRGDKVIMATKPEFGPKGQLIRVDRSTGTSSLSGFGREYLFLRKQGYVYDPSTGTMIKP